jgi:glycosyltransferase involved in cell wall biosynthesis
MLDAFPDAKLYTSLYEPSDTYPEFRDKEIRPSWLNRFAALRADHRRALPLLASTFGRMKLADADLVLCSTSGWAHGVTTDIPKLAYCYTPARWLYQTDRYTGRSRGQRALISTLGPALRRWDEQAAASVERYLTLSGAVRDQIAAAYGIEAEVVPPPLMFDSSGPQTALDGVDPGFLLCVARLLPYKNVDAVVGAVAARPDLQLVVVGEGPLLATYRAAAPANVLFTERVPDDVLRWLYANCVVNISAAYEDYGLTPLEALAFGKPSITLRYGGFLDTVVEGETGLHFDAPNAQKILGALDEWEHVRFSTDRLARHLELFSQERFASRLRAIAAEVA